MSLQVMIIYVVANIEDQNEKTYLESQKCLKPSTTNLKFGGDRRVKLKANAD
jgi:hypothetical protein